MNGTAGYQVPAPAALKAAKWTTRGAYAAAAVALGLAGALGGPVGAVAAAAVLAGNMLPSGSAMAGGFVLAAAAWGGAGAGVLAVAGLCTHYDWGHRLTLPAKLGFFVPLLLALGAGWTVAAAPPAGGLALGLSADGLTWGIWGQIWGIVAGGALKSARALVLVAGGGGIIPPGPVPAPPAPDEKAG